jgi:hypothetical protein
MVKSLRWMALIFIILCLSVMTIFLSCEKGKSEETTETEGEQEGEESKYQIKEVSEPTTAVMIWNYINFRKEPDINSDRTGSLNLGESVTWLGKSATGPGEGGTDKEWYFVKRDSGEEGWVYADAIVPDAKPAVLTAETFYSNQPNYDHINLDDPFEARTIIAVVEDLGSWLKICAKGNKNVSYYIEPQNLSYTPIDISVARLIKTALEKTGDEKKEALEKILNIPAFQGSIFIEDIYDMLDEISGEKSPEEEPDLGPQGEDVPEEGPGRAQG